jgi:hypothetical protein
MTFGLISEGWKNINQKLATVPLPPHPNIWTCVRSSNTGEAFQSSTAKPISTFAPNRFPY